MKSLEILNDKIWKLVVYKKCFINVEEFNQIKADLEVLEIIRKKNVNINRLKVLIRLVEEGIFKIEEALRHYNLNEDNLTLKELLKLKQWLEENENDR
jgi:hypothetical protein